MGKTHEMMFGGLNEGNRPKRYPCWLYRDDEPPRLVQNSEEEEQARAEGFDSITAGALSNRVLTNWFWDLEDLSPKQLCVFARDEYGADLPDDAGQERLFKAVCELARHKAISENQLVLMAHTVSMNYQATLEEISRMAGGGMGTTREMESYEVIL